MKPDGETLMTSAFLATEQNFRKIMGYRDLWGLDAMLHGSTSAAQREAVALRSLE
jgi:hypothetical protein